MIKINLLSPVDKENLRWEKINNITLQGIAWILVTEAIFAMSFFFLMEYMNLEYESASAQLTAIQSQEDTKEVKKMESDISDFKGKINSIYSIQSGHMSWTFLLENIANLVPDGVKLDSIDITDSVSESKGAKTGSAVQTGTQADNAQAKSTDKNKTDKMKILIRGNAKTRDSLLALEGNLKKSGFFSDLECDDANYVESSNIDFDYAFYVSKSQLLK